MMRGSGAGPETKGALLDDAARLSPHVVDVRPRLWEFWREVGKMGLIGQEIDAEKGGWGTDFFENIIGLEEQIYHGIETNY